MPMGWTPVREPAPHSITAVSDCNIAFSYKFYLTAVNSIKSRNSVYSSQCSLYDVLCKLIPSFLLNKQCEPDI